MRDALPNASFIGLTPSLPPLGRASPNGPHCLCRSAPAFLQPPARPSRRRTRTRGRSLAITSASATSSAPSPTRPRCRSTIGYSLLVIGGRLASSSTIPDPRSPISDPRSPPGAGTGMGFRPHNRFSRRFLNWIFIGGPGCIWRAMMPRAFSGFTRWSVISHITVPLMESVIAGPRQIT